MPEEVILVNFDPKKLLVSLCAGAKMEQKRESQAVAELPVVSVLSFYARHNANKHIFQNVKLILMQPINGAAYQAVMFAPA